MGAIAAIKLSSILSPTSLTTSATVGVDNTFDPEGFILPGVARWVNRIGGIAVGYPSLSLSVRPPTKVSRVYRVTGKVVLPTLEQIAPSVIYTKAYDLTALLEFWLPERSTLTERNAFLSLVHSLFATTITASDAAPTDATGSPLIAAVANFDPPY
jgi:hypothetical protein